MKIKITLFLFIIITAISACTKEGSQGPDGAQGPKGDTGPAGPVGPSGLDGSIIYSGTGAPAANVGANGDYYLDRSSGNLYGPKTNNVWGSPLGLKGANGAQGATGAQGSTGATGATGSQGATGATGAQGATGAIGATGPAGPAGPRGNTGATGAAGAAGSQVYSGNGSPAATLGTTGDYYLDKTNLLLYGPKTTSWGTPVLLRGAQGPQGPVGPAGADGSIIYSGSGAPDITLGKTGDYYFDNSARALYGPKGRTWGSATSLIGATGATGSTGATGATGANGNTILSGLGAPANTIGNAGDFYLDIQTYQLYGPKTSSWGAAVLLRGAQGPQGPVGPAGADGSIIYSGSGAPDPALGKAGDYYFDNAARALYGPKGRTWGTATSLIGATGATGSTGATGATGASGNTILSGSGAPANTLGNAGDFYLDIQTYQLYGPKTSAWGTAVLLRGAQGPQGPVGPAGADGSIIYSGSGAPDPALGKAGDYYFDNSAKALYGPKGRTWGAGVSLAGATGATGATGAAGANGNTILSGLGAPALSIGNAGDFYLDIQTYKLYGPKNIDGWGIGTSLKSVSSGGGNVTVFESAATSVLNWVIGSGSSNTAPTVNYYLRHTKANGDTTSVFTLPDSVANMVNNGIVLVYLHIVNATNSVWVQLAYTTNPTSFSTQYYNYVAVVDPVGGVYVKITCDAGSFATLLNVDKVRIVVSPQTATGTLGLARYAPPLMRNSKQVQTGGIHIKKLP